MSGSINFYSTGDHDISLAGPVLVRKFIGIWNLERYQEYQADLLEAYNSIRGEYDRWVTIVDLREWEVSTFDIFSADADESLACYRSWMDEGMVGECWIAPDKMIRSLLKKNIAVPDDLDLKICLDVADAVKWVSDLGMVWNHS